MSKRTIDYRLDLLFDSVFPGSPLSPCSTRQFVQVNFPEPPVRRGLGDAGGSLEGVVERLRFWGSLCLKSIEGDMVFLLCRFLIPVHSWLDTVLSFNPAKNARIASNRAFHLQNWAFSRVGCLNCVELTNKIWNFM